KVFGSGWPISIIGLGLVALLMIFRRWRHLLVFLASLFLLCRQNVYRPGTSLWRRVADWMLDVRFIHYLPATARKGAVPCISGRTAAYRRHAILPVLDEMEFETFWGKPCISGDEGRLTWLLL